MATANLKARLVGTALWGGSGKGIFLPNYLLNPAKGGPALLGVVLPSLARPFDSAYLKCWVSTKAGGSIPLTRSFPLTDLYCGFNKRLGVGH